MQTTLHLIAYAVGTANSLDTVSEERLYQLVRQSGAIADHAFEIRFLDRRARAYALAFG